MRLVTVAATMLAALSTAALAQVARTPAEAKNEPFANMAPNATAADVSASNGSAPHDPPSSPDAKTEPATPRR